MKSVLLTLFAVTIVAFGCTTSPSVGVGETKDVVVTLTTKSSTDTYNFSVAPDSVRISISNADKVDWIVSNPKAVELTNVEIGKFKGRATGGTDPFGNGGKFTFASVPAASVRSQFSTAAKAGTKDTYDYEVTGTIMVGGNPVTVKLDPVLIVD